MRAVPAFLDRLEPGQDAARIDLAGGGQAESACGFDLTQVVCRGQPQFARQQAIPAGPAANRPVGYDDRVPAIHSYRARGFDAAWTTTNDDDLIGHIPLRVDYVIAHV